MNKKRIALMMVIVFMIGLFFGNIRTFAEPLSTTEKKVKEIKAFYVNRSALDDEGFIFLGTKLSIKDFEVTLLYNNEETKVVKGDDLVEGTYVLKEAMIPFDATAIHDIAIEYKGSDILDGKPSLTAMVPFQTRAFRLKRIVAKWFGKTKYHIGDEINKKEITVTATFDKIDSQGKITETSKTIDSSDVSFEPETIKVDGKNTIKASYRGFESLFEIVGAGVKGLKVEYTGPKSLVIGQSLDQKKLKVSKLFSNGELKKITDYNISDTEIKVAGPNIITISYENLSEQLTINGISKKVEKIEAKYGGSDLVVGTQIDLAKITVTATYNDKSTEVVTTGVTVKPEKVTTVGVNSIDVFYQGLKDTIKIKATEVLPGSIIAVYNGGMVIEGSLIKKSEVSVTAYFPDGTSKTVTDFELSTETMNTVGMQEVTVTYKGSEAKIFVPVTAKMVTSISVSYKGGALVQFSSIDRKDIVVTATYNDGKTENVTEYTLNNSIANQVGQNTFTIFYGGYSKDLIVEVLPRIILGRGSLKADINGEDFNTSLTAYIENQFVREGIKLETEVLEKEAIKKAARRVNKTDKFLAFNIQVDSFQFDENKYMITEATIPDGFNPANVGIYYTPDKETVMVQLTGGLVSSNLYRFYVYRSGTYVIMEKDEPDVGRQELREEDNRTPFLVASVPHQIKVKEKRGIKAFLLFAPFENDGFLYESGDEDIISVSKEGLITAKAVGEASVTITSKKGGFSQSYDITVSNDSSEKDSEEEEEENTEEEEEDAEEEEEE